MPLRSRRICLKAACQQLNQPGSPYCAAHQSAPKEKIAELERRKAPMANLRATKRWRKYTRPFVLSRDPLCKNCGKRASTDCDHIERAEQIVANYGIDEFYNPDRCQGLCHPCHSVKTATEVGFAGTHG